MQLFWDKGYASTSLAELKEATGLNSGSLYGSYKSKEELFLLALQFYCGQSIANLRKTLAETDDPIANIYRFFDNFQSAQRSADPEKGCFFVNALIEMAPHNAKVKKLLDSYTEQYRQSFAKVLKTAKDSGLTAEGFDVGVKTNQLMLTIWGLRVMHRGGVDVNSAEAVKQQLDDIFAQR